MWVMVGLGLPGLILVNWAATEYLAFRFGFPKELGAPLVGPLYEPVAWGFWYWHWMVGIGLNTPPAIEDIFHQGLYIILGGSALLVAIVAYIGFKKTARNDDAMDLHGSARWGTIEDARKAHLLDGAGVYVGAIESDE